MPRPIHLAPAILAVAVVLAGNASPAANAQTKLLRFPDIHGEQVVFTYAGDLWLASTSGGVARRLTTHPGQELFGKFSPDGRTIAFTGQYDGDEQVYVVSTDGGAPRQLTYYPALGPMPPRWGSDNQVYGWSPDGSTILFRSWRYARGATQPRLYTVSPGGGLANSWSAPMRSSTKAAYSLRLTCVGGKRRATKVSKCCCKVSASAKDSWSGWRRPSSSSAGDAPTSSVRTA